MPSFHLLACRKCHVIYLTMKPFDRKTKDAVTKKSSVVFEHRLFIGKISFYNNLARERKNISGDGYTYACH